MRAGVRVMTAEFVGGVAAVVGEVTQLCSIHTVSVGTLELCVRVAWLHARRTQCHVVLVRAVTAVVHTVANLVSGRAKYVNMVKKFRIYCTV